MTGRGREPGVRWTWLLLTVTAALGLAASPAAGQTPIRYEDSAGTAAQCGGPRHGPDSSRPLLCTPRIGTPWATAERGLLPDDPETYRAHGAIAGGVVGAVGTYIALNTGGSTAFCDQDENQDAIDQQWCVGLYVAGGVLGATVGALLGGRVSRVGDATRSRLLLIPGPGMGTIRAVGLEVRLDL